MKVTLLSSKGQITIPQEIQRQLKIGHRSKIALYAQKNMIILKPFRSSIVEQTAGSLAKFVSQQKKGLPFEKILRATKQQTAQKLAKTNG